MRQLQALVKLESDRRDNDARIVALELPCAIKLVYDSIANGLERD